MEPNKDLRSAETKFNKNSKFGNNFDRNQCSHAIKFVVLPVLKLDTNPSFVLEIQA